MAPAHSGSWLEKIHAVLRTGGRLLSRQTFQSHVYSRPLEPESARATHLEDPLRERNGSLLRLFCKLDRRSSGEAEMHQFRSSVGSGVSR